MCIYYVLVVCTLNCANQNIIGTNHLSLIKVNHYTMRSDLQSVYFDWDTQLQSEHTEPLYNNALHKIKCPNKKSEYANQFFYTMHQ